MASFQFYVPADTFATALDNTYDWTLTEVSPSRVVFSGGDYELVLGGSGFAAGTPASGTITSAKLYGVDVASGHPVESLILASNGGLALGLAGLADALTSNTFSFAALPYLMQGSDVITGSAGNDVLTGYIGNDTIKGGAGNDTLYGDSQLIDVSQHGDDTLYGGAGNDALYGNGGNDKMVGGSGDDFYSVTNGGDVVVESANGGTDRVQMSNLYGLLAYRLPDNVETLEIQHYNDLGTSIIRGYGNELGNKIIVTGDYGDSSGSGSGEQLYGLGGNDWIYAGAGSDLLDGGTGNDTMIGGTGSDTYVVDSLHDTVIETVSLAGSLTDKDTVDFGYAAAVTVSLGGTAGNLHNNIVFSGIEILNLGANTSTVAYNGVGSDHADTISGDAGINRLYGGGGNDTLKGGGGNDVINGGAGNDLIDGGAGADHLAGGGGKDRFVLGRATQSPVGSGRDVITDWASGDKIDLHLIDADPSHAGNQAFDFIGSKAFSSTDATGQLRFDHGVLYGSLNADTSSEFSIVLPGVSVLHSGDFVL